MDIDKNGKISKQEWMRFMEAEFDRLDATKKGEIDPKELQRSTVSLRHVRPSKSASTTLVSPRDKNLDATRLYVHSYREQGRFGSHPSHDGFDDESGPD